jgi:hypothetical protein
MRTTTITASVEPVIGSTSWRDGGGGQRGESSQPWFMKPMTELCSPTLERTGDD